MYYTFVFPYLIYGVEIYGSAPLNHINLKKIQKKCVRTITFSEYLAPSEPIFQVLNVLNFENLVTQNFPCLCLNIHMEMYQSPCHNYLEPITNIITILPEIVLVFMHQLAQLKQVIELSATEGYTFGITFHKKSLQIHHIPVFKKNCKDIYTK